MPNDQLVFGKTFTDHMLEIEWTASGGWKAPTISPYHKLSLDPSASVFHYGLEVTSSSGRCACPLTVVVYSSSRA